ncbi:hypothetical protein NXY56_001978 [Leishmania guyanensis]|uniref:Uncharacterized protein n=1 Tax=Leishmania guyanensis TaxID=5670 RepID=A0A1E1ISA7_LEIGU|nr:hypothetical protein, conserved [Leishmania guyanensis]
MPLKRTEEVCGKPNQYNLKTLEYDWKELPDTHFQVPPPQPRLRNYSALAGYGAAKSRVNPITHQALPSFGTGPNGVGPLSPTPLPSPSRPAQEEVRRRQEPPVRNCNRDHVAELLGSGDGVGDGQTPSSELRRRARPPPLDAQELPQVPNGEHPPSASYQQLLPYSSGGAYGGGGVPQGNAAAAPPELHGANAFNVAWSHEDIRRAVQTNNLEAQRSYLR